jgi:anti-sigma B factor antagonist
MADGKWKTELVSAPRTRGDAVIADVVGDIDLHNSPELRNAIMAILSSSKAKKLVLNLGMVPYMDSSAIAVLVEALQKLRRDGGRVILTSLQPRVKGLLEIARLDTIFALVATEDDAVSL